MKYNYDREYDNSGEEQQKLTKALKELRNLGYYVSKTLTKDDWKGKKDQEKVLKENNAEDKNFLQWRDSNIYKEGVASWFLKGNCIEVASVLKKNGVMFLCEGANEYEHDQFFIFNSEYKYKRNIEREIKEQHQTYMSYKIEADVHDFFLTSEEVYNCLFNDEGSLGDILYQYFNDEGFSIGDILNQYFNYEQAMEVLRRIDKKYRRRQYDKNDPYNLRYFYKENIRRVKIEALKKKIEDRKHGKVTEITEKRKHEKYVRSTNRFNSDTMVELYGVWNEEVLESYLTLRIIKYKDKIYISHTDEYRHRYFDITDEYESGVGYAEKMFNEIVLGVKSKKQTEVVIFLNEIFGQ